MTQANDRRAREHFRSATRGCLLGGAIGDALGGPIEFASLAQILADHPSGVRDFIDGGPGWPPGTITDDTQMTLFTVEGIIRASIRQDRGLGFTLAVLDDAYQRWYDTQQLPGPPAGQRTGWLYQEPWLYARRAPGMTCLSALGGRSGPLGRPAENDSKGCGGVMRAAPFGLIRQATPEQVFRLAAEAAGFTHGHPTGRLAAGALAVLVLAVVDGADLDAALDLTLAELALHSDHEECTDALLRARALAADIPAEPQDAARVVESLGGGWVAEEALAIAVYAALARPEPDPDRLLDALSLAVTHSGDSDSTGAICGNLLGALHGETVLPPELVFRVEGRPVITRLADNLAMELTQGRRLHGDHGPFTGWPEHYPGW